MAAEKDKIYGAGFKKLVEQRAKKLRRIYSARRIANKSAHRICRQARNCGSASAASYFEKSRKTRRRSTKMLKTRETNETERKFE